jgi:hypothetical protein
VRDDERQPAVLDADVDAFEDVAWHDRSSERHVLASCQVKLSCAVRSRERDPRHALGPWHYRRQSVAGLNHFECVVCAVVLAPAGVVSIERVDDLLALGDDLEQRLQEARCVQLGRAQRGLGCQRRFEPERGIGDAGVCAQLRESASLWGAWFCFADLPWPFLGCHLKVKAAKATFEFVKAANASFNDDIVSPEKLGRYRVALVAAMQSEAADIRLRSFAADNLDPVDRSPFTSRFRCTTTSVAC